MWGGGVHRMEHPTLGTREGVPSEQVHALRAEGWQIRLGTGFSSGLALPIMVFPGSNVSSVAVDHPRRSTGELLHHR